MAASAFHCFITLLLLGLAAVSGFTNHHGVNSQVHRRSSLQASKVLSTYLDDANYHKIMTSNEGDKLVLVDACARWCGPCKLIEPFLEASAAKYSKDLEVVKFDVEAKDNGGVKVEFLMQGVMPQALPSLILFHNGKHIATHSGALKQEQLDEFIEANLPVTTKKPERELAGVGGASAKQAGFISFGTMRDDYFLNAL